MVLFTCNPQTLSPEEARKLRVSRLRSERQKADDVSVLTWETTSMATASTVSTTPERLARTATAELAKIEGKSPVESATRRAVRKYRKRSEYYMAQSRPIPHELLDTIIAESAQKFGVSPHLVSSETVMKRCRKVHSSNVSYFDANGDMDKELPPPTRDGGKSMFEEGMESFVEDAKSGKMMGSCCDLDFFLVP